MRIPVTSAPSCLDDTLPSISISAADGNPFNVKADFWGPWADSSGNLYCIVGVLPTGLGGGKFLRCYKSTDDGATWSMYAQSPTKLALISIFINEATGLTIIASADVATFPGVIKFTYYDILANTFSAGPPNITLLVGASQHQFGLVIRSNGDVVLIYSPDGQLSSSTTATLRWAVYNGTIWNEGIIATATGDGTLGNASVYCPSLSLDSQDRVHMLYFPDNNPGSSFRYNALNADNTLVGEHDLGLDSAFSGGGSGTGLWLQHGNVWAGSDGKVRICFVISDSINPFGTNTVVCISDSLVPTTWTPTTVFVSDNTTLGAIQFAIGKDIQGTQVVLSPCDWGASAPHFAPFLGLSLCQNAVWGSQSTLWDGSAFPPQSHLISGDPDNETKWPVEAEPNRLFTSISLSIAGVAAMLWQGDLGSHGLCFYFSCDFKPIPPKLLKVSSIVTRRLPTAIKKRVDILTTGSSAAPGGVNGKGGVSG